MISLDWFVQWEALLMYGPGSWTRAEILKTPAHEVFQHLVLSRRAEAHERNWAINTSHFHRMDKRGKRAIKEELSQQSNTGRRRLKATEQVDGETRILMIGSELMVSKEKFIRHNREEMTWLASKGITPEEAIQRHRDWLDKERQHPFWTRKAKG